MYECLRNLLMTAGEKSTIIWVPFRGVHLAIFPMNSSILFCSVSWERYLEIPSLISKQCGLGSFDVTASLYMKCLKKPILFRIIPSIFCFFKRVLLGKLDKCHRIFSPLHYNGFFWKFQSPIRNKFRLARNINLNNHLLPPPNLGH